MSKYTTEVRFICEHFAEKSESSGYSDIDSIINSARSSIFDNYPIFDETHRPELERKILRHYYTREICEETFGLWKLRLNNRMNEIMPYYNALYETAHLNFDPFQETDYTRSTSAVNSEHSQEVGSGTDTQNQNSSYIGNQENFNLYSDTPQGSLSNVEDGKYLTNATKIDDNVTTATTNEIKGSNSSLSDRTTDGSNVSTENVKGKTSSTSYSKLLKEYRETILNIDLQITESLSDLFFGLW